MNTANPWEKTPLEEARWIAEHRGLYAPIEPRYVPRELGGQPAGRILEARAALRAGTADDRQMATARAHGEYRAHVTAVENENAGKLQSLLFAAKRLQSAIGKGEETSAEAVSALSTLAALATTLAAPGGPKGLARLLEDPRAAIAVTRRYDRMSREQRDPEAWAEREGEQKRKAEQVAR